MKKTYLFGCVILLVGCILFTSCDDMVEGMGTGVEGSGNVVEDKREIGSFSKISISEGINGYIKMGDAENIRIEADDNIKDLIVTEVVGNELRVHLKENVRNVKKMNVYITAVNLKGLKSSSGADIIVETDIESESMNLNASSGGDIEMKALTVTDVDGDASSSGDITITGLSAETADFNSSSGSDIKVGGGEVAKLKAHVSSSGDVKVKEMVAKSCDANASSGGSVLVNVSETLSAHASSGGRIRYTGGGMIDNVHTSSGGSVKRD